ncbi:MAG: hypothetical protein R2702_17065 [Acidimicrobiales bacterium]
MGDRSRWQTAASLAVGAAAFVAGCAGSAERQADQRQAAARTTTTAPGEDVVAEADDFIHVDDMVAVRGFYVNNLLPEHLDETVALARSGGAGTYPVGTVIQLIPQEAMVKRRAGFDPSSNDWEFFELDVSAEGTEIHNRGGAEIVNRFGSGSCSSCHSQADPQFDFVCEDTHGCEPLPVGDDLIEGLQASDPRPRLASGPVG